MPNQFKAHLYFIQSICGFLELPDAPCHLKKTWHLLMILITRGGCFFVLKAATALQCFGIQLRDLLIPTGGIVSCWSKGYIAEGLGFLPATCSVRTIYQGASEIVKAMLCYTRVSVAGWHQPSEVLMVCTCWDLSRAPITGFLTCHPSTSAACRTWLWHTHAWWGPVQ